MSRYARASQQAAQHWSEDLKNKYIPKKIQNTDLKFSDILEMSRGLEQIQFRRQQLSNSTVYKQQLYKFLEQSNKPVKVQPEIRTFNDSRIVYDQIIDQNEPKTFKEVSKEEEMIKKLDEEVENLSEFDFLFKEKQKKVEFGQNTFLDKIQEKDEEVKRDILKKLKMKPTGLQKCEFARPITTKQKPKGYENLRVQSAQYVKHAQKQTIQ
ncbi:Hypothetical_protein [Hexamita inflata]|uniref:Hypothetical_protein n=1 Tax=Hexamita inflata TaxID=28002 RepID=A0AA86Q2V9_9EUKA|nr:Hypothetical protein HINF_LOCUS38825 [Hexamita inflata]